MPLLSQTLPAEERQQVDDVDRPQLSVVEKPSSVERMVRADMNRTATQRLVRSFERGQITHERGELGLERIFRDTPEVQNKLRALETRQIELGHDTAGGFVSVLGEAAEIVGQMSESVLDEDAARRIGLGATAGATIGLMGGPLSPITVTGGAAVGAFIGGTVHIAADAFTVEAGNAYIDLVEEGIDEGVAQYTAIGIGVVNAGLELIGTAFTAKPFTSAAKTAIRKGVRDTLKNPNVLAAARQFGIDYSGAVAGEVVTENLQELTNIAGSEIAKQFSEGDFESITAEEIAERLAQITIKTFKGMSVLAFPGASVNFVSNASRARQAGRDKENLQKLKELGEELDVLELPAEDIVTLQEDALNQSNINGVRIPVEQLDFYAARQAIDADALYTQLGVSEQIEEARLLGGDVHLTNRQYVEHIQRTDLFEEFVDHIRFEPDDMTANEALEFEQSGLEDEIARQLEPSRTVWINGKEVEITGEDSIAQMNIDDDTGALLKDALRILPEETQLIIAENIETKVKSPQGKIIPIRVSGLHSAEQAAVWLATSALSPRKTARHEAIHALRASGVITPEQWTTLEKAVGDNKWIEQFKVIERWEKFYKDRGYSADQIAQSYVEEAIAEAFATFQAKKLGLKQSTIDKSIEAIFKFLESIVGPIQARIKERQLDAEKIFDQIEAGLLPGQGGFVAANKSADLMVAESHLGLQALFRSAREAGMTSKQYETYLTSLQKATDMANSRLERKELKKALKVNVEARAEEREKFREQARETVANRPIYAALNAIGRDRLDRAEVLEILAGSEEALKSLPKINRRNIYTPKGETTGMSPETLAELYGFDGGDIMIFQWIEQMVPESVAVEQEIDRLVAQDGGRLTAERDALESALSALHNDRQGEVLARELNALRATTKEKKLRLPLLKAAVRARMGEFKISAIQPSKFEAVARREAVKAARLLRAGDRQGASQAKFRQLLNFQFAKQAYAVRDEVAKQRKYLQKWNKKPKDKAVLPVDYHLAIQQALGVVNLKRNLSENKRRDLLLKWASKEAATGTAVQIPEQIVRDDGATPYTNLTLHGWNQIHNLVKEMEHKGLTEGKMLRESLKASRQEIVDGVVENIETNLKDRSGTFTETRWQRIKAGGREYARLLLNADSILRNIDGFEDLGNAYKAIKGGIDRAMTEGFNLDQIGFVRRQKKESQNITELFSVFSKKERLNMTKKVNVPGVRRRMSHQSILSVLLNSGNIDNRAALVDSNQFTEAEIEAIHDFASERDWKFAQATWDYLDTFWPEVQAAVKKRKNVVAKRVTPMEIVNKHGRFRGGYYPLQYDARESILQKSKAQDEMMNKQRFGRATASHTQDGHTEERVLEGGKNKALKLDLQVISNHVNQVTYDLEMGDAVHDSYKILYHPDTQKAFRDAGQVADWEALDLWLTDVVTGELHMTSVTEHMARHIRSGFTVSKIGFNLGTIFLQPLGLLQSATLIGKTNTLNGLRTVLFSAQIGKNNIYDTVARESGFMEEREATFQQDIAVAKQLLKSSLIRRITPGNTAEFFAEMAFYGIKKVQRFVDTATWLGAQADGLSRGMSEQDAKNHADRMVARSQASGNFQERTALERGSLNPKIRQSELVRAAVPLISYFMAKTNVAFERTKRTQFIDPVTKVPNIGATLNWATDMMMLYTVEALLAEMIRQGLPDDLDDLWKKGITETLSSFAAGIPGVRDAWSEARGFRGGGALGSTLLEFGEFTKQVAQLEFDQALAKSAGRLFGTLFAIPGANQAIKTGTAVHDYANGEDVDMLEFMMGPRWKAR